MYYGLRGSKRFEYYNDSIHNDITNHFVNQVNVVKGGPSILQPSGILYMECMNNEHVKSTMRGQLNAKSYSHPESIHEEKSKHLFTKCIDAKQQVRITS